MNVVRMGFNTHKTNRETAASAVSSNAIFSHPCLAFKTIPMHFPMYYQYKPTATVSSIWCGHRYGIFDKVNVLRAWYGRTNLRLRAYLFTDTGVAF